MKHRITALLMAAVIMVAALFTLVGCRVGGNNDGGSGSKGDLSGSITVWLSLIHI